MAFSRAVLVFFLSLAVMAAAKLTSRSVDNLQVECFSNGSYKISLDGKQWFRSGPFRVRDRGQWFASDSKTLELVEYRTKQGKDATGTYTSYQYLWVGTDYWTLEVATYVNVYDDVPAVLFDLQYLGGVSGASIPGVSNGTIAGWPSFVVEETDVDRGYLSWSGSMAAYIKYGKWSPSTNIYGDIDGGVPLVVFDSEMNNTVVISPANMFMSASQSSYKASVSGDTILSFGPSSLVDTVPVGQNFTTILVAGQNVTGTMMAFGGILRDRYGKTDALRKADSSINNLGYWTDNGACYYYNNASYDNYTALLVAVKKDADANKIPYKYLQIDSWWYFKGTDGGVKNWTAMPIVFPTGIKDLVDKTGWPIVAHNRWWSPQTDYAKQNGGKYDFIVKSGGALPLNASFWQYLLSSAKEEWGGLMVYEQDWLYVQTQKVPEIVSEIGLGQMWLEQMGQAALDNKLTIQYCMPWPRHLLQSVSIPAVTQTRVSDDYTPGNDQWMIGVTTILAESLGLAAFKDNFHTTPTETGCHNTQKEVVPVLETFVAALSGGPVGPSDHIGKANHVLILATCMADGRLLKPTRPAMSIDSSFLQKALGSGGPDGELWAAYSEVSSMTWYYIIAGELKSTYSLSVSELPPSQSTFPRTAFPKSIAFQYNFVDGRILRYQTLDSNSSSTKLSVSSCDKEHFQFWAVAPVLENASGVAILGELTKVVTFSPNRFVSIDPVGTNSYNVSMVGAPTEEVYVVLFNPPNVLTVKCVIDSSGTAQLSVPSGECG